ncbi:hypothetical protein BR93DRAFT_877964 [Coniochaeta sp. PMI_546]|nr:hypothetical protein BR93DRAFT_877964 [Coniochaeta sp. PMI_546]
MGSLTTLPETMAGAVTRPPELSDAEYVRAVLKQPTAMTEDEIEQELLAQAAKLGIDISALATTRPSTPSDKLITITSSGPEPAAAVTPVRHARTGSNASNGSGSTLAHPHHPFTSLSSPSVFADTPDRTLTRKRSKSLSFAQYEKYLSHFDPNLLHQPKFGLPHPSFSPSARAETASVFADSTRRSVQILKHGLAQRLKWRRKTLSHGTPPPMSCICCREDFVSSSSASADGTLPCGHTYCHACLSVMIAQSTTDESKMPPRCCTQPIPGSVVRAVLARDEQQAFLKAVQQYATPWEARVFCPNPRCGEFIPPRATTTTATASSGARVSDQPRHHHHHPPPTETACRACRTSVCVMCKGPGHRAGQDCPDDRDLDAVLRMGERSGWRRCYKCRTLVELTQGCTHMTCRCKAQFCYICGAVWDPVVGCPNYCNGEEELERRRVEEERRRDEEERRLAEEERCRAEEEREGAEAGRRTVGSEEFRVLVERQRRQMGEFGRFEHKMRWVMWTRHSQRRLAAAGRHEDQADRMRERHAKTEQHLEDRQIEAEMELRAALEQSERSIAIQLKYMEAYCNGPRLVEASPSPPGLLPEREVTRKHRELLVQQYHLRDGMERRHQSQINVLREKQARRMEELTGRHERELRLLGERRAEEVEDLGLEFANEEEALARVFGERRERMLRRWAIEAEVLRREMERRDGVRYGPMQLPEWPCEGEGQDESLPSVREEDLLAE